MVCTSQTKCYNPNVLKEGMFFILNQEGSTVKGQIFVSEESWQCSKISRKGSNFENPSVENL